MSAVPPVVEIEAAAVTDLPAVVAVERASFSDPWSARAFENLLGRDAVTFAVARCGGQVIGYVVLYSAGGEAELANLAVAPAERRHGVGVFLLEHAVASARGAGARDLWLEVRASNVAARGLYARQGFAEVGARRRYYRAPVEDAVVMRRELPP